MRYGIVEEFFDSEMRDEVVVEVDKIHSSCEIEGMEYMFLKWEDKEARGKGAGGEYGCGCGIRSRQ